MRLGLGGFCSEVRVGGGGLWSKVRVGGVLQ